METHSFSSWVGYFFTALALGCGWTLGCYVMGRICNAVSQIGKKPPA